MSVAILPSSPVIHGQVSMFAPKTSAAKRPKLSLNTVSVSDQPFRSKQSTSLRLDTLSATSPTARNTFGNAYTHQHQPSKLSLPLLTRHDSARPDTPHDQSIVLTTSSPISATCEIVPVAEIVPYTIGYDVSSILRNGPTAQRRLHRHSPSQSKPIFAVTKRVIFRAPLTEEVKNRDYTLRHSDLTALSASSALKDSELQPLPLPASGTPFPTDEGDDVESTPATPVAGRGKTDRHWHWTIGPDNADAPDEQRTSEPVVNIDDTS